MPSSLQIAFIVFSAGLSRKSFGVHDSNTSVPARNFISSEFSVDMRVPFNVNINGEKNDQSGFSGRVHSARTK